MKKLLLIISFAGFLLFNLVSATPIQNEETSEILNLLGEQLSSPDDIYWDDIFASPVIQNPDVKAIAVGLNDIFTVDESKVVAYNFENKSWTFIGLVNSGNVFCLHESSDKLYAGGNFAGMGGGKNANIAVWNRIKWDSLGNRLNGKVFTICSDDSGHVYAGGEFTNAGDSTVNHIAFWDGIRWNSLNGGTDGNVRTLFYKNGKLYAGGDFLLAGSIPANKIAVWDTQTKSWSPLGNGLGDMSYHFVSSIAVEGNDVVAAGNFYLENNDDTLNNIAKWDGNGWKSLGDGFDGMVNTLLISKGKLYAGGDFNYSGTTLLSKIAMYDDNKWILLGNGLTGGDYPSVIALSEDASNNIYAGGSFNLAGKISCNGFVKWDGQQWIDMFEKGREGVKSTVGDFVVGSNFLYAGGGFVQTGKAESPGISKFDGDKWLGCNKGITPMADVVYSMQAVGDEVYFTGWFIKADSTLLNNVAKWNETQKKWYPIGRGIDGGDGTLGPIAVIGNDIYAGGDFIESGDTLLNGLAHWDGNVWRAVGSGENIGVRLDSGDSRKAYVDALAYDGKGNLYVAGLFTNAGDIKAKNLAVYNINTGVWSTIGQGITGFVRRILILGDSVIFAGSISKADTATVGNIAIYNTKSNIWTTMGSGLNGSVSAIIKWFDDFYIGGSFSKASGKDCIGVAKYNAATGEFEPLGSGLRQGVGNGRASALKIYKNALYVGGMFTSAGGKMALNFSRYKNILTSVDEHTSPVSDGEWMIYPNPNTGHFTISSPSKTNAEITLYDIYGNKVMVESNIQNINKEICNIKANLSNGTYFIKISTADKLIVKKIQVIN